MAIIEINGELCTGCRTCVEACIQNALNLVDGKPHVTEPSACIYCLSCMENCPSQAISLADEAEDASS